MEVLISVMRSLTLVFIDLTVVELKNSSQSAGGMKAVIVDNTVMLKSFAKVD